MKTPADKTQENQSKAVAHNVSKSRSDGGVAFQFVDNRPEAIAQRKLQASMQQSPQVQRQAQLQAKMNNSPRVKAQAQLQARIDNSPHQVVQRQQLERMFGPAIQRQEGVDEEELQLQAEPSTIQRQNLEDEALLQGKTEPVQRQGDLEDEELLQGKFESRQRQGLEDEDLVQGKFAASETLTHPGQQENRTGMPDDLKAGIENLSGMSMDDVKVHYNSAKPAQLNALAYTQGTEIHVESGQEQHLPHEGWHVVQQKQRRVNPTIKAQGVSINDDEGLEREADVMGAKAMQMRRSEKSAFEFPIHQLQRQEDQEAYQQQIRDTLDLERLFNAEATTHASERVMQRVLNFQPDPARDYIPRDHTDFKNLIKRGIDRERWTELDNVLTWFLGEGDYDVDNPPGQYNRTLLKTHMRKLLGVIQEAKQEQDDIEDMNDYISYWKGWADFVKRLSTSLGGIAFIGGGILKAITNTWFRSSITAVDLPPMTIEGLPVQMGGSGNATFSGTLNPIMHNDTATGAFQMSGLAVDHEYGGTQSINVTITPGTIGPSDWVPIAEGIADISFYGGIFITFIGKYIAKHFVEPRDKVKEREKATGKLARIKQEALDIIAE